MRKSAMTDTSDTAKRAVSVTLPQDAVNPILVEVTRGDLVESVHRGRVAVVDVTGKVALQWGDTATPVFPRSAIKAIQALPLVETGAADAFALSDAEIAIACASHSGEARHVETVRNWLDRIGLSETHLECGAHWPRHHQPTLHAMLRAGETPGDVHNNCSGKHSGMLTTAHHLGEPLTGYTKPTHPVQQRVLGVLEQMCGLDLGSAPRGTDGCSIPTVAIPLGNLALGMARFADPGDEVPPARAAAVRRIAAAMAAHPEMVAGTGRYCSAVIAATKGRALVKTGAEGVFCAALPALGLGVALKCEDGARRGSEAMMTAILLRLGVLDAATARSIDRALPEPIVNWNGRLVGEVRAAGPLGSGTA